MKTRTNGQPRVRHDTEPAESRQPPDAGADIALGIWVLVSLAGIGAGLVVAKQAQAWAADPYHPGAMVGATVIATSVGLSFVALRRYLSHRAGHDRSSWLATPVSGLCTGLGWVALMVIAFVN